MFFIRSFDLFYDELFRKESFEIHRISQSVVFQMINSVLSVILFFFSRIIF